jgi:hypothetical protein
MHLGPRNYLRVCLLFTLSLLLRSAVPSKHAEHTYQAYAYPERTGQELKRSMGIRIRN